MITNYDFAIGTSLVLAETKELASEDQVQEFIKAWEKQDYWVSIRKQRREDPSEEFYNCIAYTQQAKS